MFLPLPDHMVDRVTAQLGTRALVRLGRTSRALRAQMSPILVNLSAERIRRFLRWCRYVSSTRVIVSRFLRTGLSSVIGDEAQFAILMASPSVNVAAGELLRRIYRESVLSIRPRVDSALVSRLSVQVFVRMYAIQHYPGSFFSWNDDRVAALRNATRALVRCMDAIVAHVSAWTRSSPTFLRDRPDLAASFPLLVEQYRLAHDAWQSPSPIERIKAALRILQRAQVAPQHLRDLADRIGQLRARLGQLGGEVALAELDREGGL